MNPSITVVPAYGRDYKTAEAARQDWRDGKDFLIVSPFYMGSYMSIRDAKGLEVWCRINKRIDSICLHKGA